MNEFGKNYEVRNSPVFFIIASFFLKIGIELNYLKYLNLIIILPIIIFFIKSINLKFQNLSITSVTFLTSVIFLSPTVRSLAAWPYPLLYAICFFQISIFYFLKFHRGAETKRLKYCLLNIIFLALSAYFTPNFAVFSIFFLFYFFKNYKLSKKSLLIIGVNLVLSLPAIYFLIIKDFYLFKHETDHVISNYSIYDTLNISNKIIIISSILFFFLIPLIEIRKIKIKTFFSIKLFNLIFFNFKYILLQFFKWIRRWIFLPPI